MQTKLTPEIAALPEGQEADSILRRCVHCGFCNATCPTYQLRGDELDGPRGRIYLIKMALEGNVVGEATQKHLDRCLNCRACETTCPSGVEYGRLADIGKSLVDAQVPRPSGQRLLRFGLRNSIPYPSRLRPFFALARWGHALLPVTQRRMFEPVVAPAWPAVRHPRRLLAFAGCVQRLLAPQFNAAAATVLDAAGVSLVPEPRPGCCGALEFHLGDQDGARQRVVENIAFWESRLQDHQGVVSTSSGCTAFIRDYPSLFVHDPVLRERAARVARAVLDPLEVLDGVSVPPPDTEVTRVAIQEPCTLQHALGLRGRLPALFAAGGYSVSPSMDGGRCCGSAGAYSMLQPEIANQLRQEKLGALTEGAPQVILTANIGCYLHLKSQTEVPVRHWLELAAGQAVPPTAG